MIKILCLTVFCLLFLAQIADGQTQPTVAETKTPQTKDTKTDYPNLKTQAEEVGKATIAWDFEKVIFYTYPKMVEMGGGKDKLVVLMKAEFEKMKADGFELLAMEVGEISQIAKVENELFAIVPSLITLKTPNGKIVSEGTLIGISSDSGSNWKFINGMNQTKFQALFPKAAETLKIPDEKLRPIENE